MPASPRHIRVFLASPADVVAERELALEVLAGLQYDPLLRGKLTIEEVAWDKKGAGAPMLAGITPQTSIARGLPRPSECDLVVVIFWSRMGTPLPEEYRKADGSRYESGTEWEYDDAVTAFHKTGKPYVLLFRRTQKVLLNPDDPRFAASLAQYEKVRNFFGALRNPDGSASSGFETYEQPSDFSEKLEHNLKSLIARSLESDPVSTVHEAEAIPATWSGSPFPGLRAFSAHEAAVFFGRVREVDEVIARVAAHPLVAVVGASGSGKSSLVAAGVVPRLQLTAGASGERRWIPVQFTPDQIGVSDPFASIAAALLHAFPAVRSKNLGTQLREQPERLVQFIADVADGGEPSRVLLFVDQFEELFTTIPPTLRDRFIEMLRLATDDARLHTIITVRADFYGRCVEHPVLTRMIESSTFPLSTAGVGALGEMIAKPAARAGLTFDDALAQRILDDTGDEPGALALMAYTLDELYRASASGCLTHAAYDEIGGVQGAIGKRSEAVFLVLGEEEKNALPRVFRELVEVDERGNATRQRVRFSRVADTEPARRLTDALTEARLLVQSRGEDNEPMVEVAHEALFRSWSRLADWVKAMQDDLRLLRQVRTAAAEWGASGRRDDFLWSHERLAPVYGLRETLGMEFEPLVADFVRPEFARLAEAIKADTRFFRQRPHIERLIEIGAPAAASMVECLQYATTVSARTLLHQALARRGPEAVALLVEASRSESVNVRQCAAGAFMVVQSPEIIAAMPRLLADPDSRVREAAIRAAARSRDSTLIAAVAAAADDPEYRIRKLACIALGAFWDDAAVEGLLNFLSDEAVTVRRWTIDTIVQLAMADYQSTRLVDYDAHTDELRKLVGTNQGALRWSRKRDDVARALVPLLRDSAESVRSDAVIAMLALDHPLATDLFVAELAEASEQSLPALLSPLAYVRSPEAVRAVAVMLKSPHDFARAAAAEALLAIAKHPYYRAFQATNEALFEALLNTIDTMALARLVLGEGQRVRESVVAALDVLGLSQGVFFRDLLSCADEEMRAAAAVQLGIMNAQGAVEQLIAMLDDTSPTAVAAAAFGLSRLGAGELASKAAIRAFIAATEDEAKQPLAASLVPLLNESDEGRQVLAQYGETTWLDDLAAALRRIQR